MLTINKRLINSKTNLLGVSIVAAGFFGTYAMLNAFGPNTADIATTPSSNEQRRNDDTNLPIVTPASVNRTTDKETEEEKAQSRDTQAEWTAAPLTQPMPYQAPAPQQSAQPASPQPKPAAPAVDPAEPVDVKPEAPEEVTPQPQPNPDPTDPPVEEDDDGVIETIVDPVTDTLPGLGD